MKNLVLALVLAFSFTAFGAGKVDVTVSLTPAGSFHIESPKVKGKLKKKGKVYTASKISVKVKDMKTGMDLRDEHMAKRISSKKHKSIVVTKVKASGGKGKGTIEIKGIKKPFKFSYTIAGKMMKAKFKLNLADFKIKDLKYLGVGAKKIVSIVADIPVK